MNRIQMRVPRTPECLAGTGKRICKILTAIEPNGFRRDDEIGLKQRDQTRFKAGIHIRIQHDDGVASFDSRKVGDERIRIVGSEQKPKRLPGEWKGISGSCNTDSLIAYLAAVEA